MQLDTDDLIDSAGVAALLSLKHNRAVSIYRQRYPDFPEPVINMGAGRCMLWLRGDVEQWAARRQTPGT